MFSVVNQPLVRDDEVRVALVVATGVQVPVVFRKERRGHTHPQPMAGREHARREPQIDIVFLHGAGNEQYFLVVPLPEPRSRNAILRLGAKEEGTLRKHMLAWNGRQRDSVYFSILDTEWPTVKSNLEKMMGA